MNMKKIIGIAIQFPLLAPACAQDQPRAKEVWDPVPVQVNPANEPGAPPSDAIVLFNGQDLQNWESAKGGKAAWKLENGFMTVVAGKGDIKTVRGFGDCQLHIEWRTPEKIEGEGQGRGNSGVFLMDRYEVQVLDSYNNRTYSNGQAGSLYKQHIPLVNASRPPGEWQSYDIIFIAPRFKGDGSLESPAYVTVFHNGVLIQQHVSLLGNTVHTGVQKYEKHEEKLPIRLQDHGNPVSFRNIWIREL
jgi:hypothetical protein